MQTLAIALGALVFFLIAFLGICPFLLRDALGGVKLVERRHGGLAELSQL